MRPLLAALALVAALGLSACEDDDEPSGTSSAPTTPTSPPAPSETEPTEAALDACRVLDAKDVGRILGAPVSRVVAEGGCRFASGDDPSAASLGISQGELRQLGGIEGARAGIRAIVKGKATELPDVGDAAFVVVGSALGGDSATGAGAVALGTSLIQITVIPAPEATVDDVRGTTVELLTLIAEQAGR